MLIFTGGAKLQYWLHHTMIFLYLFGFKLFLLAVSVNLVLKIVLERIS